MPVMRPKVINMAEKVLKVEPRIPAMSPALSVRQLCKTTCHAPSHLHASHTPSLAIKILLVHRSPIQTSLEGWRQHSVVEKALGLNLGFST